MAPHICNNLNLLHLFDSNSLNCCSIHKYRDKKTIQLTTDDDDDYDYDYDDSGPFITKMTRRTMETISTEDDSSENFISINQTLTNLDQNELSFNNTSSTLAPTDGADGCCISSYYNQTNSSSSSASYFSSSSSCDESMENNSNQNLPQLSSSSSPRLLLLPPSTVFNDNHNNRITTTIDSDGCDIGSISISTTATIVLFSSSSLLFRISNFLFLNFLLLISMISYLNGATNFVNFVNCIIAKQCGLSPQDGASAITSSKSSLLRRQRHLMSCKYSSSSSSSNLPRLLLLLLLVVATSGGSKQQLFVNAQQQQQQLLSGPSLLTTRSQVESQAQPAQSNLKQQQVEESKTFKSLLSQDSSSSSSSLFAKLSQNADNNNLDLGPRMVPTQNELETTEEIAQQHRNTATNNKKNKKFSKKIIEKDFEEEEGGVDGAAAIDNRNQMGVSDFDLVTRVLATPTSPKLSSKINEVFDEPGLDRKGKNAKISEENPRGVPEDYNENNEEFDDSDDPEPLESSSSPSINSGDISSSSTTSSATATPTTTTTTTTVIPTTTDTPTTTTTTSAPTSTSTILTSTTTTTTTTTSTTSTTERPPISTTTPTFDFTHSLYNASIAENSVLKAYAISGEKMGIYISDPALTVRYKIVGGDLEKIFRAESRHVGDFFFLLIRIRLGNNAVLNREYLASYELRVRATVTSSRNDALRIKSKCTVLVTVTDRNDLSPFFFDVEKYQVEVREDVALDTAIFRVRAVDPDIGRNGEIYYSLAPSIVGNHNLDVRLDKLFAIHPTMGTIYSTRPLMLSQFVKPTSQSSQQHHSTRHHSTSHSQRNAPSGSDNFIQFDEIDDSVLIRLPVLATDRGYHHSTQIIESSKAVVNIRIVPVNQHSPKISIRQHRTLSTINNNNNNNNDYSSLNNGNSKQTKSNQPNRRQIFAVIHVSDSDLGRFGEICQFDIVSGNREGLFIVTNQSSSRDYNIELATDRDLFGSSGRDSKEQNDDNGQMTSELYLGSSMMISLVVRAGDCGGRSTNETINISLLDFDGSTSATNNNRNRVGFQFKSDNYYREIHETSLIGTQIVMVDLKPVLEPNKLPFPFSSVDRRHLHHHHHKNQNRRTPNNNNNNNARRFRRKTRRNYRNQHDIEDNNYLLDGAEEKLSNNRRAFSDTKTGLLRKDMFTFQIIKGNENGTFGISRNGAVFNRKRLDRETRSKYILVVRASQHNQHNQLATTMVHVDIVDDNDNWPLFLQAGQIGNRTSSERRNQPELYANRQYVELELNENHPNSSIIFSASAHDLDFGNNAFVTYDLIHYDIDEQFPFDIDIYSGNVSLIRPLDFETLPRNYLLFVRASDWGEPFRRQNQLLLNVSVLDVNDHRPQFEKINCTVYLPLNTRPYTEVMTFSAVDLDQNSIVQYKMYSTVTDQMSSTSRPTVSASAEEFIDSWVRCFRLNEQSGQIELICNLRKESAANRLNQVSWQLAISATDGRHFSDTNYVRIVVVNSGNDDTDSGSSSSSAAADSLNSILDGRNRRFSKRSKKPIKTECTDSGIRHKLKHQFKAASLHGRNPVPLMPAEVETIEQMKLINRSFEDNRNNAPIFPSPFPDRRLNIAEDIPVGSRIFQFVANDSDPGYDGALVWSINLQSIVDLDKQSVIYFEIDQFTGELFLIEQLDYEQTKRVDLVVTVCDQAIEPKQKCSNQTVTIEIQDINDNPPLVDNFVFNISESASVPAVVGTIFAVDKDSGENSLLHFTIDQSESEQQKSESDGPMFSIDPLNGTVRLERPLDREVVDHYVIYVRVSDHGKPNPLSSISTVTIYVDDVNDNAPEFYQKSYFVKVREDIPVGTRLTRISAFDRDESYGANDGSSLIRYSLNNPLDQIPYHHQYQNQNQYRYQNRDDGKIRRRNVVKQNQRQDFNENDIENGQKNGNDDQEEDDILKVFSIDDLTGNIRLNRPLNYEKMQLYNLTIVAVDDGKPTPLSSSTNLVIEVEDVDENFSSPKFPEIFGQCSVRENQPPGTLVTTVKAVDDDDPTLPPIYQIVGGSGLGRFMIDSGGNILTSVRLDAEVDSHFWLTIVAKDRAAVPQTTTLELYVEIENLNDMPSITGESLYQLSIWENRTIGSEVLRLVAIDQDFQHRNSTIAIETSGNNSTAGVLYRIATENVPFTIDPMSGSIRISHGLDREQYSRYVLDVEILEPISTNRTPPPVVVDQSYLSGLSSMDSFIISRTPVIVSILDVNEFEPKSIMHTYRCYSYSRVDVRLPICQVIVSDRDSQPSTIVVNELHQVGSEHSSAHLCSMKYELVEGGDQRFFRLDPRTGIIYPTVELVPKGGYDFMVKISDCGEPVPLSSTVHVIIRVIMAADRPATSNSPPTFEPMDSIISVSRSEEIGFMVAPIKAMDDDFDRVCYYIVDGNVENSFALLDTGALVIARSLSRVRSVQQFNLTILITDGIENVTTNLIINILNDDFNLIQPFSQPNYTVNVLENITVGSEIVQLRTVVMSQDEFLLSSDYYHSQHHSSHSETRFAIYSTGSPATADLFEIEPWSGKVRVKSQLDFESGKQHWLLIEATDSRKHPRLASSIANSAAHSRTFAKLVVNVFDVNDQAPQFILSHFESSVLESASVGTSILQIQAFDDDFGSNGMISYSISSGNINQTFDIEPTLGYIFVQKANSLSNQRQPEYYLVVRATDQGVPPLSSTANVHLSVNVPDNSPPKFEQQNYFIDIREDEKIGAIILSPRVSTRQTTFFEISSGDPDNSFGINVNNGEIYLRKRLDYEQRTNYTLRVAAVSLFSVRDYATIFIAVIDINDNVPYWKESSFEGQVYESTEPGSVVLSAEDDRTPLVVRAYDRDSVHNAILIYSIVETEAREYFEIDPQTGSVTLLKHLDYETWPEFNFTVSVSDYGYPSLKAPGNALVRVRCLPVNDCPPIFEQNNFHTTLLLPTYADVIVTKVTATDCDRRPSTNNANGPHSRIDSTNADFSFAIVSVVVDADSQQQSAPKTLPPPKPDDQSTSAENLSLFKINKTTGQITTGTSQLEVGLFLLTVSVNDGKFTSTAKVYINAKPVPRSSLRFHRERFYGSVKENSSLVQRVTMPTIDGNKLHEYLIFRIMNPTNYFSIARTSGAILFRGTPVDREQISKFELAIEVQSISLKNRVAHALVEITIEDINDNSPIFVNQPYSFVLNSDSDPGSFIGKVQSVDLDSGSNAEVSYAIIAGDNLARPLFSLDRTSGHLTLARTLVDDGELRLLHETTTGNYTLLVSARDHGSPIALESFTNVTVRLVSGGVPVFGRTFYNVSVSESHPPLVPFATIKADSPHGRQIFYNIEMGNENEEFALDFNTDLNTLSNTLCMVSIAEKLDRETAAQHNLLISAIDSISGASTTINLYINVEDTNDNQPMFTRYSYNVSVPENLPVGSSLLRVSATDADSGLNSKLQYRIVSDDSSSSLSSSDDSSNQKFSISPEDGVIYLKSSLDYERETGHRLTVSVSDYGTPKLSSTTKVWIEVQDVNDNAPKLARQSLAQSPISIDETIGKGEFVTKIIATDRDWIDRDRLRYRILSGSDQAFWINETSGAIFVRNLQSSDISMRPSSSSSTPYRNPLLESIKNTRTKSKSRFDLNVSVSDGVYSTTGLYQIQLKPVNRYSPKFSRVLNNVAIGESLPIGGNVFHISASDRDESHYGLVEYYIMNDFGRRHFQVDPISGDITLRTKLDYELGDRSFWLILAAQDHGKRLGVSALRIAVTDENDNLPRFIVDEYQSKVCSNVDIGTTILAVYAVDDDEDAENTVIRYTIYNSNVNTSMSNQTSDYIDDYFEISSETGYIYTRKNLSSLTGKVVQFFVKATNVRPLLRPQGSSVDSFSESNENVVPVSIQITDQCPYQRREAFLYEVFVKENVESGSVLANIALDGYREAVELKIVGVDSVRNDGNDKSTLSTFGQQQQQLSQPITQITGQNSKFRIDKFGRIFVNERLDRETRSRHILAIQLTDRLSFSVDYLYVVINIMDDNDCTPYFDSASYYLAVAENQEVGSSIYKINAIDDDIDVLNNALRYSLNDTHRDTFLIDDNSGWLVLNRELDRETMPNYSLQVLVSDGIHLNSTWIHVEVFDVNDNPPSVEKRRYIAAIQENSQLGTIIVSVEATDPDLNPDLRYQIVDGDYLNQFAISSTGDVFVNRQLDREFIDRYRLRLLITDGKYQTETELEIDILDVDDNGPICIKSKYVEMVSEAVQSGTFILTIEAVDNDQLENSKLYFSLDGEHRDHFSIDPFNGNLQTNAPLDRETHSSYFFSVVVADHNNRQWTCTSWVEILLSDVNDEPPKFLSQINSVNIPEDSPVGIILGKVTAIDLDQGENRKIRYELGLNALNEVRNENDQNDEFMIDEHTGIIRLSKSLDREQRSLYNLTIFAYDSGLVPLNSSTNFVVNVTDINDNAPEFERQSYHAELLEDVPIGTTVMKIFATSKDTGINAEIGYRLISGNENGTFSIDSKTGILTISKLMDYETIKEYFLIIRAVDRGIPPLSSEVSLQVTVQDINDVRPQFVQRSYDIVIREDALIGDRILQLVAIDLDSTPNANLTYSFAGGSLRYKEFEIDSRLGMLTVGDRLDRESMSAYILEVFCTDNGLPPSGPLSTSVLINVEISDYNDNPPTFSKLNQTIHVQEGRPVGYILQQFMIQDADSALNSGPFKFAILSEEKDHSSKTKTISTPFTIHDSDGSLRTNAIFNHSSRSEYYLTIQVTDSGTPPLSSLNWITVMVIEEPKVPPKLQPLLIVVNSLEQFPGGVIGHANASDQDRFDKLIYGLVSPTDKQIFSIDPNDGTLVAFPGLDVGKYELNISVTDGRFVSYGLAKIEVILLTETMIEHSLVIEFRSISVKSFVMNYLRSFVRIVKNLFNVRSKDVFVLSVQPAERKSMRHRYRRNSMIQLPDDSDDQEIGTDDRDDEDYDDDNNDLNSRNHDKSDPKLTSKTFGDISIMFTVASPKDTGYFSRNWLKAKLLENKAAIQNQLGLQFEEVLLKSECSHYQCKHGECREDLVLSENEITSIVTERVSFVSPFHEYRVGCACQSGFGGKLCETTVNECARNPCPPHKECLPISSTLGYLCQCPFGKSGPSCNQNAETCHPNDRDVSFCYQEFSPISFVGNSYVRYALVKKIDKISLRFRSQQLRAKIFTQQGERAFSILEIAGGYIQFRFDCGDGEGLIRITNQLVNDGRWHEIIVERKGNKASLVLDRKSRGAGFAPGAISACNRLKEDIYFGGKIKDPTSMAIGEEQILNGFVGCLDNILFNGQQIPFHTTSSSSVVILKTLANVEFSCNFRADTGACKSQPCLNGATCNNLVNNGSYSCLCNLPRYAGKNCEIDQRPCDSGPCLNGGICRPDRQLCLDGAPNCYKCECRPGFTGKNCNLSRYCTASLCQNGGVCEETQLGPKCHCHSGWLGLYCQLDVDECQLSTPACFAPATCINLPGTFRCICPLNSTVACNGEGLIPSNIVSSQFYITIEETAVLGVILLLLILFACFLALWWNCRNRKCKNGSQINNHSHHHHHHQHNLKSSNGKHGSGGGGGGEASEKLLNQPIYDSFNGGNNHFRTPTKSNNLEMCNLTTANNILLGHAGSGAVSGPAPAAAAAVGANNRQPRPTSFNDHIFNQFERVQQQASTSAVPSMDTFNEEGFNETTSLMAANAATMTIGVNTANNATNAAGPSTSAGLGPDSFIITTNFNKKNAPIASVSPQLIETSATITKSKLSPKVHLNKPKALRNSLINDSNKDLSKNQRVSLNDSADSNALFSEAIHNHHNQNQHRLHNLNSSPSLTNSTNHLQVEGYHWDNSDIYLSSEPGHQDCPQYENASALSQLIQAASANIPIRPDTEEEFAPLLPPKMNKRGGAISNQNSELLLANSPMPNSPAATAVSESPTLDAKIGAKLEQHSRKFLEYYLPKHAEDGADDTTTIISHHLHQEEDAVAGDVGPDPGTDDCWNSKNNNNKKKNKNDVNLFKRKNILQYPAMVDESNPTNKQVTADRAGSDSVVDPTPRYGHVRRNGTFKVADNRNKHNNNNSGVGSLFPQLQHQPQTQNQVPSHAQHHQLQPVTTMLTFKRSSLTESCDNFSLASSASSSSPPSSASLSSSLILPGIITASSPPANNNLSLNNNTPSTMSQLMSQSGGSTSASDVLMMSSSASSSSSSSHSNSDLINCKNNNNKTDLLDSSGVSTVTPVTPTNTVTIASGAPSTTTTITSTNHYNNNNPIYRNIGPCATNLTSFGYGSLQHPLAAPPPPIPPIPLDGPLPLPTTSATTHNKNNKFNTNPGTKQSRTTDTSATAAAETTKPLIQPFNKTTYL